MAPRPPDPALGCQWHADRAVAGRPDRRRGWCAMIIDKRSVNDERRTTNDERRPAAKSIRYAGKQIALRRRFVAQFSIFNFQFSIRSRWVRLLLLILTVVALSVIGATLGHGFSSGVAVVGQAVGPTRAAVATPVPQPARTPPLPATATPIPAVAAMPALAAAGGRSFRRRIGALARGAFFAQLVVELPGWRLHDAGR